MRFTNYMKDQIVTEQYLGLAQTIIVLQVELNFVLKYDNIETVFDILQVTKFKKYKS